MHFDLNLILMYQNWRNFLNFWGAVEKQTTDYQDFSLPRLINSWLLKFLERFTFRKTFCFTLWNSSGKNPPPECNQLLLPGLEPQIVLDRKEKQELQDEGASWTTGKAWLGG